MENQLKESMQKLIDLSLKGGANSCDVILSKGSSFSLSAQNEKIDKYQVSGSQVMGLRVIKDQKIGLAYSESTDEDSLSQISRAAIENAKNSEVNEFEQITYKAEEFIHESEFKKDSSTTAEKIDFCLSLESEVKAKDKRVTAVPYNGFSEVEAAGYYLNSLGTFTYESEYYQSCYTSALVNEGSNSSMHYESSIGRVLKDLDKDLCVNESINHATAWLDARPLSTGSYDILFTADAFSSVFNCFNNIFSGKAAMEKTNPFGDKLNTKVMSSKISISDRPQYTDSFSKSYVDSEGIKQKDFALVKEGVLCGFFHNTATAKFFKTQTTGHGSRGAKSSLSVGGTTKVIEAGDTTKSDYTSGEYFEIHALQGLHSGANAITGDFSFAASGYLMRDGKVTQPVKGVTVSGNFHKMLKDINIIGDTVLSTTSRNFFSPAMRFESVSIAGI